MAATGLLLVIGGRQTIVYPDRPVAWVDKVLGAFGRALTSVPGWPRGVALGFGLLLVGALLIALAVGLPALAKAPEPESEMPAGSALRRVVVGLFALMGALAGASVLLLRQASPGAGSVITWLAALMTGLLAAWMFDRQRRTGFGNPFPREWEWTSMVALVIVDLIVVGHDVGSWRWAGTPDESYFFALAKGIAKGQPHAFVLSENGVFGYHPVLSSYYQALFMKLFGVNVVAWRLSSATALATSLPFLYLTMRELWNRRAGVIAAVLFGTAQLAVGFAHLGYNNVQVYPILLGSLGVLAWSVRRRSVAGYYLAGGIAGLGFFTYYPARLAPLLAVLLLWSLGALSLKRGRAQIVALVVGTLLAVLPLLLRLGEVMTHMLQQTAMAGSEQSAAAATGRLLGRIFHQWALSVLHPLWSGSGWNFDWNPVVDPVAAGLAMVGLWLGVGGLARRGGARFLAVAYLLSALVVGGVSPYEYPPLTRLLTLAPFTAMLAALALDRVVSCASRGVRGRVLAQAGGVGLAAAAVLWNVTALHRSIYQQHHGYGDGTTSELIRLGLQWSPDCRLVYIQHDENDMYNVDQVLDEFGLGERTTCIRPFSPRVADTVSTLVPPFAVVYDLIRREEIRAVEEALAQRFPDVRWADSAPGERWNLRYASLPDDVVSLR